MKINENLVNTLAKVAASIAESGCNIANVSVDEDHGMYATNQFTLQVANRQHLAKVLRSPAKGEVFVGMVGKYVDLTESYKSLTEALRHSGIHTESRVNIEYVDSEDIEAKGTGSLSKFDAILVPQSAVVQNDQGRFVWVAGADGKAVPGEWNEDLKPYQWASAESAYQAGAQPEIDLKVKRSETETFAVTVRGRPNPEFGTDDRGLIFQTELQVQKAADVGDAIRLGALRTARFVKVVYMNLYSMVFGRVSVKTMSGPLTIATVSYRFAGEDFWQFLLFLGMISVNLAVVNFLPIPVLDGGHMVFLIYEKVTGRPVPERLFAVFMYAGLFMILSLMLFVVVLDVRRLFFGWF